MALVFNFIASYTSWNSSNSWGSPPEQLKVPHSFLYGTQDRGDMIESREAYWKLTLQDITSFSFSKLLLKDIYYTESSHGTGYASQRHLTRNKGISSRYIPAIHLQNTLIKDGLRINLCTNSFWVSPLFSAWRRNMTRKGRYSFLVPMLGIRVY